MPATPRPWKVNSRSDQWCDIKPVDAEYGYTAIAMVSDLGEQAGRMFANASLIVNAVNCHDDLLDRVEKLTAALKMVKDWCELNRREGSVIYKPVTDALKYIK